MVGVPGKTGGCASCRSRKKGCDKQSPFCGQCIEAGLVCKGYLNQHAVWINSTGPENPKYTKASRLTHVRRTGVSEITLHKSLSRTAREDRYVGLFMDAYLPNGRAFSWSASQISPAGWLRYHDCLCRSEKTLRLITLAHGLSMLATSDHDSQLKGKGFQAYRMAVQEMRVAVQDRRRARGDGLLAAVRLFRFYEILYGAELDNSSQGDHTPQIKGFYAHTDGEIALFMNRGCYEKWTEAGRHLLADGRIVSFILGISRRKRSPFSDSAWMTSPWRDTTKSPLDQLTDIMIQTPGILEELDTIRELAVSERSQEAWNNLLDGCRKLDEALRAWKTNMGSELLLVYDYTHSADHLPTPQVDRDFAVLHISLLYWSTCVILYTTVHFASSGAGPSHLSFDIPFASPGVPKYQDERNPTLHACRIAQAVALSYESNAGGYGALCSTFPLGIALRYLMVANCFPHEGGAGQEMVFLKKTLSQPFMQAYSGRFLDNLQRVDTTNTDLKYMEGWNGVELMARRWWFGPAEERELRRCKGVFRGY